MKIKVMLLLATAALVALSLTALPALTGADTTELWWKDDQTFEYPQTQEEKEVRPKGELAITQGGVQYGPCQGYEFKGTIWNEIGGMGEGKLETLPKPPSKNCPTNRMNCTVLESTTESLPWSLTLTAAKKVKFSGIKIQLHLSPGCAAHGLALTPVATGNVEGELVEAGGGFPSTVLFNNSAGLSMNGAAATLDGRLEFGTLLTALPEP